MLCNINFLLTWNTFSCNINFFLSTLDYFLNNIKLFVSIQNSFSCNTRFLFWTLFRLSYNDDIFLLSRSNKNMCQKNKISFLCDTKKLISFFLHHKLFIFNFYIEHLQHVDFLRSGPRNKATSNPSFTHLPDIRKQLLRAALEKSCSCYLGLAFVKHLWRANILAKLQASFPQLLQKIITKQVFFQDFT